MVAASAALTISGVPFMGPIGAARVGYIDGEYVLNLDVNRRSESKLDLVMAGTQDAVLMVESEAQELSEEIMLGAVMFGHTEFQTVINAIIDLAEQAAKEPWDLTEAPAEVAVVRKKFEDSGVVAELAEAYKIVKKQDRYAAVGAVKKKAIESLGDVSAELAVAPGILKDLESEVVRGNILKTGIRIDGRDTKTVRAIEVNVGVLPRAHGSALFTRGETQALVVATLGTGQD
jgi:polyribonucleotide nucleotidyltransferase